MTTVRNDVLNVAIDTEDNPYLYDNDTDRSEALVLGSRGMVEVCRVVTPQRVPHGYHPRWVPEEQLATR
jgi:carotenoid cleavage dioxygenase-like enzyme